MSKAPNEDFCNGSSQSRVVLAKPRLGGFGSSSFASSSSKPFNPFASASVLRPSQLKPGSNPFLKVTDDEDAEIKNDKEETSGDSRLKVKDTKKEDDLPKFVPLGANVAPRTANPVPGPAQSSSNTSSSGFVFGQNLSERVVMKESVNNGEPSPEEHSTTNGNSDLLFTAAVATVKENNQEESVQSDSCVGDGLAAAAAEYERSHARPPPPTSTITVTGEEDETNVLQITCRLFAWETGSWRERGRGVARLNEAAAAQGGAARLVLRVAGSLRVALNTRLWPGMVVERAGTKSLRITALDAQHTVKLFLIMGAPGDIAQLYRALTSRVASSKLPNTNANTSAQNISSQQAAERLEATADENGYLEKQEGDDKHYGDTDSAIDDDISENEPISNDRLEPDPQQKTEEYESNVDGMKEDNETKSLKRKETTDEESSSPKRQCPKILIE